jgi:hypothetical protein
MVGRMRGRLSVIWCSLSLLAWGGACSSGTETGNPSLSGALSYTGYSSKPGEYGVREGGSVATVTNAWLDLGAVEVSPQGACGIEDGEPFTVPGLGIGDHAAGNHNSTEYSAPAGRYCTVALPFVKVPRAASGLPDELLGQSLLIVGTLADGTPFSIASSAAPLIELRASSGGFSLSSEQADAVIAFDFAAWLGPVDFAAAASEDGQIIISESSNVALLEQLEANWAAGVALYRDRDGDGLIDPDAELLARFE